MIAEDRYYIDRVLAGKVDAFEGLVRKYNRMAGAIAFGIVGDFSTAEDIVQESFLKAFKCLGNLRSPEKFKVWFAGIVRSRAIDWIRRKKTLPTIPFSQVFPEGETEAPDQPELLDPPVEEIFTRKELREKLLETIRSLPEEDRIVITLKHMEGFSYREIAELTGTTVGAVESRLFRARRELRRRLNKILK